MTSTRTTRGSVLYAAPHVRITAQLIRAETDEYLWAGPGADRVGGAADSEWLEVSDWGLGRVVDG